MNDNARYYYNVKKPSEKERHDFFMEAFSVLSNRISLLQKNMEKAMKEDDYLEKLKIQSTILEDFNKFKIDYGYLDLHFSKHILDSKKNED